MKYLPGNAQHIGAREEQQDAFAFSNPADKNFLFHAGVLALVSDGMGGLSHGHEASSAAVRAFLTAYEQKTREESIPAAMHRSFKVAFAVVQDLNQSTGGQSGATLVAAVAHASQLYWVSAGDSRLYLIRRGRLVQLTRDHSYREKLLDQVSGDRMGLSEAMSNPEREHLTSYLGMPGPPEVDCNVRPFHLEPGDQVVLCTDGVYRAIADRDFVTAFAEGNPSESCDKLKALVLARASQQQDNLTVAALRCAEDGFDAVASNGSIRSKIAVSAAGVLFCANVFAADFAWKTLRHHTEEPKVLEDTAPRSSGPAEKILPGSLPPSPGSRSGSAANPPAKADTDTADAPDDQPEREDQQPGNRAVKPPDQGAPEGEHLRNGNRQSGTTKKGTHKKTRESTNGGKSTTRPQE